jgi:hypothetical protein
MALFGSIFHAAWSAADTAAKGAAAALATGAKAVGQIPVAAAQLEAQLTESCTQLTGAAATALAETGAALKTTAAEWQGWMDVKAAQAASAVGLPADVGQARRAAQQRLAQTIAQQNQQINEVKDEAQRRLQQLQLANQRRIDAAKSLRQKIAAAAQAAGGKLKQAVASKEAAVTAAGDKLQAVLARGAVKGLFAVAGAVATAKQKLDSVAGAIKSLFSSSQPATQPVAPCGNCSPAARLQSQLDNRQALLDQAKQAAAGRNDPKLNKAIENLEKNVDASKKALMADDVYSGSGARLPKGWSKVSDEELRKLGLSPSMFTPQDSKFRAALYKSDDKPPKYTLAYKGTTMTSEQDWENNLLQGMGLESDYYQRALMAARATRKAVENAGGSLSITGHSLGGGLASAGAIDQGLPATTFNAAGLHQATVPYEAGTGDAAVQAYQVQGEVLTRAQSIGSVLGAPQAAGVPHSLAADPNAGAVTRHGMDAVMDGLNQEGAQDAAQVSQLLGQPVPAGSP